MLGSVDLYGDREIAVVTEHCRKMLEQLNRSEDIPFEIVLKETLLSDQVIRKVFAEANQDDKCAGVITSMRMCFTS